MRNIDDVIEDDYWYFKYDELTTDHKYKNGVTRTHYFRAHRQYESDFNSLLTDCRAYINQLLKRGVARKVSESLAQVVYTYPKQSPDELFMYEASGILMGGNGWRMLADIERINEVLAHTMVHLRIGRKEQSFRLKEL